MTRHDAAGGTVTGPPRDRADVRRVVGRLTLPLAATAFLVGGCTAPGGPEVSVIEIAGSSFSPTTLEVAPGTEVRWTNTDPRAHTVTSGGPLLPEQQAVPDGADEFDSGRLLEGETFAHVFDIEGDYYYWCEYHGEETMVGTIRVMTP